MTQKLCIYVLLITQLNMQFVSLKEIYLFGVDVGRNAYAMVKP
jgi:hypothetical protein